MTGPLDDPHPRGLVRALLAVLVLGLLVAVVPLVLVALTQALPVDLGAMSPATWGRADDGRLLLVVILAVAWTAWAVTVLSIGVEIWAAVRRVPTPTLPGLALPQRLSAVLVAAILVALSPAAAAPAAAGATTPGDAVGMSTAMSGGPVGLASGARTSMQPAPGGLAAVVAVASLGTDQVGAQDLEGQVQDAQADRQAPAPSPSPATTPIVTTERHDTLWMLAEQHLGSGERYVEIVELNRGLAQPDGRSLGDDGRLYPGWTLVLPADAVVTSERPARHRVVRGDTLWDIAEKELGDPTRYPEIAEANQGDLQPDGRRLADPDLILPGWILEVPGATVQEPGSVAEDAHEGTAEVPAHVPVDEPVDEPAETAVGGTAEGPGPAGMAPIDRAASSSSTSATPENPSRPARAGSDAGLPTLDRAAPVPDSSPGVADPEVDPEAQEQADADADAGSSAIVGPTPTPTPTPTRTPTARPIIPTATPTLPVDSPDEAPTPVGSTTGSASYGGAALSLPAGGAVAALLLAGVGAELVRRRGQFQRHRRPGERMPLPGKGAREVERAARVARHEPGRDLLDRALVQLAEEARSAGLPVPDVRLVRVGEQSVCLDLAGPAGPAIAPFVARDDTRWVLSHDLLPAEPPPGPRALPGLVTVGFAGPETVLLNLESVGTLAVTGPEQVVGDVIRGLAADLAFGPARALTERTLCLTEPAIAEAVEAGDIAVERNPVRAAAALRVVLDRPGSTDPAEVDPQAGDPRASGQETHDADARDPLLIVLSDRALGVSVPPRSGCALITAAPVVGAGATLVVQESGMCVLLPEREHLAPQRLSRAATEDVVEALRTTDLPGTGSSPVPAPPGGDVEDGRSATGGMQGSETVQAGLWDSAASPAEVIDLRASSAGPHDPTPARDLRPSEAQPHLPGTAPGVRLASDPPPAGAPRVLLLGEVLVENAHGKCESTRIGRLAETAAFVLLNPGSRPSELQGALWPGRRSNPQTCRQMISRARTWLGRTDSGDPYLMTFAESAGRLRLRDEVTSDWADFQRLAEIGLADPEDTEHLTQALGLVRGRPFGAVASRELPWADLHINEMISLISDVAHALAVRHEAAGRQSAARDAALRGLRTESESEILEAIVARTVV